MKDFRGKKICRSVGAALAVLCWLLLAVCAGAEDSSEMRIEQARIYMPDIKVYYYPGSSSSAAEDITATLNDEKLAVVSQYGYDQDETGSDYYILADISLSISHGYFANVRQAILEFQNGMRDKDTLTVITFGDEVTVVAERAGRSDDIRGTIEGLENNDYNTHLFEAFDKTAELADREELIGRRSAAIVITDGEDCSTNESTKNEALEELQEAGIPLYAMAVRETANGNQNAFVEDFSDFVRATNGKLSVFGQDEAVSCIQEIQSMLNSVQVLELKASSNRITPVMQPLALMMPGAGSEAIQVCPRYNQKDTDAPTAKAERTSEKELTVSFSEAVKNADQSSSYRVNHNGEMLAIYAVNYNVETLQAALTFSEPLQGGEYTIEFQNITDASMEENKLTESVNLSIEAETEAVTEAEEEETSGGFPVPLAVGAVAVLALVGVIVFLLMRRKKPEETEEEPVLTGNTINLEVRSEEGERTIKAEIQDELIVGRSASCDISLLDKMLSRRHFSIEKDSGSFYITDLDTTNGTVVNGVKITNRCKLKNGDVVRVGSLNITITW